MKLMLIALLLSVQFVSGVAPQPRTTATTAAPAEAARLMVVVAAGDKGAAFLREVKPTLDRLRGRVVSAEGRRNPVLDRDETQIVLSFESAEGANNFMTTLSGGGGGGGATEGHSSTHSCSNNGMEEVCYFRFGSYRFVCVKANGAASGTCLQM